MGVGVGVGVGVGTGVGVGSGVGEGVGDGLGVGDGVVGTIATDGASVGPDGEQAASAMATRPHAIAARTTPHPDGRRTNDTPLHGRHSTMLLDPGDAGIGRTPGAGYRARVAPAAEE